jgi:hypothetical protein
MLAVSSSVLRSDAFPAAWAVAYGLGVGITGDTIATFLAGQLLRIAQGDIRRVTSFCNENIVTERQVMNIDMVLWAHVATGVIAWIVGAVALWANLPGRRSRGALAAFHWSVFGVAVSASVLVAQRPAQLWWLWLLAILSYGLALFGYLAPRDRSLGWLRLGIHGQGGACIALVTATFVVSLDGLTRIGAWSLPTLIGVPLLELWYRRAAALTPQSAHP